MSILPEISVVIVTRNQRDTIAQAIESVLAQQCAPPVEIVIGEDASTDDTRAVCLEYAARYPDVIRVLPAGARKGVVENYTGCLRACRGRYIADCAGDDFWTDNRRLADQYALMEAEPDVAMVHCGWEYLDGTTGSRRPSGAARSNADMLGARMDGREVLRGVLQLRVPEVVRLSTALLRADAVRRAVDSGVLEPRYMTEDVPLCAHMCASGRVAYIPRSVMCYRVGGVSVSSDPSIDRAFDFHTGLLEAVLELSMRYGTDMSDSDNLARRLEYVYSLAVRLKDTVRRDRLNRLADRLGLRKTIKARIHRASMSSHMMWRIVSLIRGL